MRTGNYHTCCLGEEYWNIIIYNSGNILNNLDINCKIPGNIPHLPCEGQTVEAHRLYILTIFSLSNIVSNGNQSGGGSDSGNVESSNNNQYSS